MAEIIVDIGDNLVETIGCEFKGELVRCKECENFNPMIHGCQRSPSVEPWWEDDFCSYGERKSDE